MRQEPKLLTEAEWREMSPYPKDYIEQELRERGLIAQEPVKPLLIEAREVCASECGQIGAAAQAYREGRWDSADPMKVALAALRRGMELAQRPEPQPAVALTREMVREAADVAAIDYLLRAKDYDHPDAFEFRIKRLHAALTEMMKGEAK
jgi:hypothetical protein